MSNILINGVGTLTDIEAKNNKLRPQDWAKSIVSYKMNNGSALTILMQLLKKKEKTTDPIYNWFEGEPTTRLIDVGANFTAAATTITTQNKGNLRVRERGLLKVLATGEILLVTAAPTDNDTLTVQRGFAGTTAAALDVATQDRRLVIMGSAFEEMSTAPSSFYETPITRYNHVQTFRATWGYSGTAANTTLRGGFDIKSETKKQALLNFELDQEAALWFGRRSLSTVNNKACYTMGGVEDQLPATQIINCSGVNTGNIANGMDLTGGMTYSQFEDLMNLVFRYGSRTKMGFATTQTITNLSRMARLIKGVSTNIDFKANITSFGMNVTSFSGTFGTLVLKSNPAWDLMGTYNGFKGMDGQMYILDMDAIAKVESRPAVIETEIQAKGTDGRIDGILTEFGFKLLTPAVHAKLSNIVIKSEI